MLEHCAPGFTTKETGHHRCIKWKGKTYPAFPLGKHGGSRGKGRSNIQVGHIKRMVNTLGIAGCAKERIEALQ